MLKLLTPFALLLLLTGCGAPGFFTIEQIDEPGLRNASTLNANEPQWDFKRPANWEISDKDWNEMHQDSSTAYLRELRQNNGRRFYVIAPGKQPDNGALVELKVTDIDRGHYTFFTYMPAVVQASLTITDAKSGKVLFKGKGKSRTSGGAGPASYGDGGRIESAHVVMANEIIRLVEYYNGPK